jgi:biotin carboxyl carrier protein
MRKVLRLDGRLQEATVRTEGARFAVETDGRSIAGSRTWEGPRLVLELDGRRIELHLTRGLGGRLELWLDGERHVVEEERRGGGAGGGRGTGEEDALIAPMPARVVRIAVAVGDAVTEGQTLVVLESMKMELGVTSPRDGRVARVGAVTGVIVPAGTTLVELEPAPAGDPPGGTGGAGGAAT